VGEAFVRGSASHGALNDHFLGRVDRVMVKLCAVKGSFGFLHVLIFEGPRGL
jgi:hypothetical protein